MIFVRGEGELGACLRSLPRSVRLLGPSNDPGRSQSSMYEFEVVAGNAAYREGERFYLTAAQAQRAYPAATGRPRI